MFQILEHLPYISNLAVKDLVSIYGFSMVSVVVLNILGTIITLSNWDRQNASDQGLHCFPLIEQYFRHINMKLDA